VTILAADSPWGVLNLVLIPPCVQFHPGYGLHTPLKPAEGEPSGLQPSDLLLVSNWRDYPSVPHFHVPVQEPPAFD
jgi:hypothetical protein